MNRRNFIRKSAVASVAAGAALSQSATVKAAEASPKQEYYKMRHYHIRSEEKRNIVARYLKDAAIPALNRNGVQPIGVFYATPDQADYSIYTLSAYPSLDKMVEIRDRIKNDEAYLRAAGEYLSTEKDDPAYERIEVKLMRSFAGYPKLQTPRSGERIFEMRTYESHNEKKATLKVEMFNEAELEIFRKVKLDGVFYGETLVGPKVPNLTYMLAYKDMEERKANWQAFGSHPDWQELRNKERYKDTVSNIVATYLIPAPFSQI